MRKRVITSLVVGTLAVIAAVAIAVSDDERPVAPADFEKAAQAAVAATGGGQATSVDRDSEDGAAWEVEVTKADGSRVDVLLDAAFRVIRVSGEQDAAEAAAPATPPDDDAEKPVSSEDATLAGEAALKAVGGGTVESADYDAEDGATWEVEVIKTDGSHVDVLLDAQFNVLRVGGEQDPGEPADDSDGD